MWTHNRSKLINDLNETALGLIDEAEYTTSEHSVDLIELAGTLDRLRVELIQDRNRPNTNTHVATDTPYISIVRANFA